MCRAVCTPEQKSLTSQTDKKCPENTLGSAGVYLSIFNGALCRQTLLSVLLSVGLLNLSLPRRQLLGTRARESLGRKKVRCCLCMDEC